MAKAEQNDNPVIAAALDFHRRGWCVIPVLAANKKSSISWKLYQTTRPSESQVRKWFGAGKSNIGLICGAVSGGLTVLDFDDAGLYRAWAADHPDLAATLPTVRTDRGYHVYCRSGLAKSKQLDGIDLKASGYVLAPPSIHPSGSSYRWINPLNGDLHTVNLEDLGVDLTQETHETRETQVTHSSKGRVVGEVMPFLTGLCGSDIVEDVAMAIIETLPERPGQRNKRIFLLAQRMKSIPAYTKSKPEDLKEIVRVWHNLALPTISTKPFELTWIDFLTSWPKVKHLRMSGELGEAMKRAKAKLEAGQGLACGYESDEIRLLLQTCYELRRDDGGFEMGHRKAGEVMGMSRDTGGNVMAKFVSDGWMDVVEKGYSQIIDVVGKDGKKRKKTEKFATVYRWKNKKNLK
jgi:hypothetical protein